MKEVQESCQLCENPGHLHRVPQVPNIIKEYQKRSTSAGSLTKDFIEQKN